MKSVDDIPVKKYTTVLVAVWAGFIAFLLVWNIVEQRRETLESARIEARASFENDLMYRLWAAGHGGVYVPITEDTPPNPHLTYVENRDITTMSGMKLTMINPAYMTRQVYQLGLEQYGYRGHITSLNPIRPENKPDEWERDTLEAFAKSDVTEVTAVKTIDNEEYMRLMGPMSTKKSCLKCHAHQGYKEGDIRGGISISIPLSPLRALARRNMAMASLGYGITFLLGLVGIGLGAHYMQRRIHEQERVTGELRESEVRFRTMFESSTDAVILLESESFIDCNEATLRMFKCSREEFLSKHPSEVSPPTQPDGSDSRQAANERMATALREKHHFFPWTHRRMNGEDFPAEVLLSSMNLLGKNVLQATVRDITKRKKAEEELLKQRSFLQKAQEIGGIGTWELDISKNEILWTDETYRIFGLPIGTELTHEIFLSCIHPDDREYVDTQWKAAMDGRPCDIEHRLLSDGKIKWVREKAELEFDDKGKCIRVTGVTQDITERRGREDTLRESEERFRSLFENAPLGYQSLDENGNFIEVNETWCRSLGYKKREVLGRNFSEFLHPSYIEHFLENFPKFKKRGYVQDVEFKMIKKDGSEVFVLFDGKIAHNEDGSFRQTHCVLQDVTERKKSEEEHRHLEARVQHSQRLESIGVLAGGIAHDFNNILYAIQGFTEWAHLDEITGFMQI